MHKLISVVYVKLFPSENYFFLLQIRAACGAVAASFVSGAVAVFSFPLSAFIEILFLSAYFFTAVFYIPMLIRTLSVTVSDAHLFISKGVIFKRRISVSQRSVRYFERRCSLLSRRLNVYSVLAHTSSGNVRIGGLDPSSADTIAELRWDMYEDAKEKG